MKISVKTLCNIKQYISTYSHPNFKKILNSRHNYKDQMIDYPYQCLRYQLNEWICVTQWVAGRDVYSVQCNDAGSFLLFKSLGLCNICLLKLPKHSRWVISTNLSCDVIYLIDLSEFNAKM